LNHPNVKDRDEAVTWSRQLLTSDDWLIWDTETTGIGHGSEIVQIAAIDRHGNTHLDMLIWPTRGIPAEATAIHGLTNERVAKAPTFPQAWHVIEPLITRYHPVIYNVQYDLGIIVDLLDTNFIDRPSLPGTCAMRKYSAFVGEFGRYRDDYKWQKLPNDAPDAHSAISDCRATLRLIQMMAEAPLSTEAP